MNDPHIRPSTAILDGLIILLLLLPSTVGLVLFGGVRLWVSGPLMAVVFAAAALQCLRFGARREDDRLRIPPALVGLLLLACYALLVMHRSSVPGEARIEVLKILSYAVAYAALCNLAARRGRWRILLAIPLLLVSGICWYALIQHAQGSTLVLIEPRPEQYAMRASGTFFCPNHFAYVLALVVVLAAGISLHRRAGWPLRILALYAGVLALPVLLLTESRSGWIGAAMGISVLVLLLAARRGAKRFLIAAMALLVGLTLAGGGLWFFSSTFHKRVQQALRGDIRILLWKDTLQAIQDQPVWGHGPGTYRWIYPHYKHAVGHHQMFAQYAHNDYLNFTVEYGGVGAALLGATVLVALAQLLRLHRRVTSNADALLLALLLGGLAATAAHTFFDFNLHVFAAVHLLLLIAAAILGAMYADGELRVFHLSRGWRIPLGLGGAVLLTLLSLYTVRVTAAYLLTVRAESLRTQQYAVEAAQQVAERAVQLDPLSYSAYEELARILYTRSTFYYDRAQRPAIAREAIEAYEHMLRLNPLNYQANLELSLLYAEQLDDPAKALALLQEAIDYAPYNSEYSAQMGHRLRKMGYPEEALAVYENARKYNPTDKTIQFNIANLKKQLGKK